MTTGPGPSGQSGCLAQQQTAAHPSGRCGGRTRTTQSGDAGSRR